jgi:Meiotically up-regulated gene 113
MIEPIECEPPVSKERGNVYCFQLGDSDCFKVGRTKNSPEDRQRGFSTGSSEKFKLYKTIPTEYAGKLEQRIHQLLDSRRAENGEFFNVTARQLDLAVEDAQAFVETTQPVICQAEQLRKQKPLSESLVEPSQEMVEIYQRLRKVRRDRYLIEQEIDFLESMIQVAIGRNAGMREIASWKWIDYHPFDVAQFKQEEDGLYKQLYQKYQHDSSYRKFSLERVDLTKAA